MVEAPQTVAVGLAEGAHWLLRLAVVVGGAPQVLVVPETLLQTLDPAQTVAVGLPDGWQRAPTPLPSAVMVGVAQTEVCAPETLEQLAVAPQTVAGDPDGAHWLPIEAVIVG